MHPTKNDLPEHARISLVQLLNTRLADAIDVMIQAKQAHWNIRGSAFIALHELFDRVKDDLEEYADLIAERAAQLGGTVEGTVRVAAGRSTLNEYPLDIVAGHDHVDALSSTLAAFGKTARHAIQQSDKLGDADTADIFTEVSRGTDKLLWLVESHCGERP